MSTTNARVSRVGEYKSCRFHEAHASNYKTAERKPGDGSVSKLIIHVTESLSLEGVLDWFHRWHPGPSSTHYVIGLDGTIVQCVREKDVAYGAPNANRNGIHIEHVGLVGKTIFPLEQLEASAKLVAHLAAKWHLPVARTTIQGHAEVPGSTHSDPGATWPWKQYMQMVGDAGGRPSVAERNVYWRHPDGIFVSEFEAYHIDWPVDCHHAYILANGGRHVWYGTTVDGANRKLKLSLAEDGHCALTAIGYNAKSEQLFLETLDVVVK